MRSARSLPRRPTLGVVLRQLLPAAAVASLLAAVGILHVAARTEVLDTGYLFSQLEGESRALTLENDRLKLELATLKRSARLEKLGRENLGMAPPASGSVTVLKALDRPTSPRPLAVAGRP